MADDEDPFDEFEDAADREGDPFDDLGYPADEDAADPQGGPEGASEPPTDEVVGDQPEAELYPDADDQVVPGAGGADGRSGEAHDGPGEAHDGPGEAHDGPGDAGEVQGAGPPQDPRGDPFDDEEGVFERVDVGDMDPDAVFEQFAEAEERGTFVGETEREFAEVDKHRYCEACKWFSPPPEVHCTHSGTEILEFLDMETVRVVDCPVVEERKQLGERE